MLIDTIKMYNRRTSELIMLKLYAVCSFMETSEVPYLETYKEKTWGIFYKTRVRWNYKIEVRVEV